MAIAMTLTTVAENLLGPGHRGHRQGGIVHTQGTAVQISTGRVDILPHCFRGTLAPLTDLHIVDQGHRRVTEEGGTGVVGGVKDGTIGLVREAAGRKTSCILHFLRRKFCTNMRGMTAMLGDDVDTVALVKEPR
jgi:hypothetical protein